VQKSFPNLFQDEEDEESSSSTLASSIEDETNVNFKRLIGNNNNVGSKELQVKSYPYT